MKVLLFLALILSVYSVAFAAEALGVFGDPDHPGKCVYENLVISAGAQAELPNTCGRLLCGENSFGTIQTCGVSIPPSGCIHGDYINVTASYPECCEKKIIC